MLCRLCLQVYKTSSFNIINSKSKYADLSLIESLYWIFGVEVDVNDPYSKQICVKCEKVVRYVGNYRSFFQRNQMIIKGTLLRKFKHSLNDPTNENEQTPRQKKAKSDFIKYYYNIPTTAIQDLIRDKNNDRTATESDDESLCQINEEVPVEVCKYCSQIYTNKKHLTCHYDAKHRFLIKKSQDSKSRQTRFKRNKRKKQAKITFQTHPNKFKRGGSTKKSLFDAKEFPNLNFLKQLEVGEKAYGRKKRHTETSIRNRYKSLNLKDFHIPIVRCEVPRGFQKDNAQKPGKSNATSRILRQTSGRRKEIEPPKAKPGKSQPVSVTEEVDAFGTPPTLHRMDNEDVVVNGNEIKQETVNEHGESGTAPPVDETRVTRNSFANKLDNQWRDCDGKILAVCKSSETVSRRDNHLRDRYKSLNLKNLRVPIERCPVPRGFFETVTLKEEEKSDKETNNRTTPKGSTTNKKCAKRNNKNVGMRKKKSQLPNLQVVISKLEVVPQEIQGVVIKSEFGQSTRSLIPGMPQLQNEEETDVRPGVSFTEKPPELEPQVLNAPMSLTKPGNSRNGIKATTKRTMKKPKPKPYNLKRRPEDKVQIERQRHVVAQIEKLANTLTSVRISTSCDKRSEVGQNSQKETALEVENSKGPENPTSVSFKTNPEPQGKSETVTISQEKERISEPATQPEISQQPVRRKERILTYSDYLRMTAPHSKDIQSVIKSRWLNLTKNNTAILSEISKSQPTCVNSQD